MSASPKLSPREIQVVELIVDGRSDKAIALELEVSIRTVHAHVSRAMTKTHTRTRTQLAVYALRAGIVPLNPIRGNVD